jgi:polysaccharide pyruvyl transferase WcaK-like protein
MPDIAENSAPPITQAKGTPATMKVFFVADNRTSLNWGRGASIALGQLLSASFDIVGRVNGDLFDLSIAEAGYVGTLFPPRYYQHFRYLLTRQSRRPFSWYMKVERLFGAKDFIAEDPSQSIDNLLFHRNKHSELNRIYDQAAKADCLVLDGDGDIIFSTPPRRTTLFLLAMIELGVRLDKPVFLVNSMISDCPLTGRNEKTLAAARRLFSQCAAVTLRDPESLEYVQKEMPEARSSLIPDSLFAWYSYFESESSHPPPNGDFILPYPENEGFWGKLDFSEPYICIGGGALASSQPERSIKCYGRLVDGIRQLGYRVYLTENDSPDRFLRQLSFEKGIGIVPVNTPILECGAVLAHARLFIAGRYHPSIFASLGGTPCIFLASHAHKMGSLSRVLEYDNPLEFNAFPEDSDVEQIVATAKRYLSDGESLRARIKQVASNRCEEARKLPALLKRHMNG